MDINHFDQFVRDQRYIQEKKNKEYSNESTDTDWAFKTIAKLLEGATITPFLVALIYKLKHTLALVHYAKFATTPSGESIRGRLLDDSNYNIILDKLKEEHYNKVACDIFNKEAQSVLSEQFRYREAEIFLECKPGTWTNLEDIEK